MTRALPNYQPEVEILRPITVDKWRKPEQTLGAHGHSTHITLLLFMLRTLAGKRRQLLQLIRELRRSYIIFCRGGVHLLYVPTPVHTCHRQPQCLPADRVPPVPHSGEANPVLPVQRHRGDRLQSPRLSGQALVRFPLDRVLLSVGEG